MKLDVTGSEVAAEVGIGPNQTGGFALTVQLTVRAPALTNEDANRLTAAAHEVCPYSNATRGNIDVTLNVP
jgi:Ohr subfamily peroxiredoxin